MKKKLEALKQYLQQCVEEGIFPGCQLRRDHEG